VAAKSLLHLGNRAAVDQALSRLTERGQLIRAGRGVYLRPITSRFGTRAPPSSKRSRRSPTSAAKSSSRAGRRRPTLSA
jgi:hypothetical protein